MSSRFEKILHCLGGNLRDFICGLDNLHEQLLFQFPGMQAPSFRVDSKHGSEVLIVYYNSVRNDLQYMVVGMLKAVAKRMYQSYVDVVVDSCNDYDDCTKFIIRPTDFSGAVKILPKRRQSRMVREDCQVAAYKSTISSKTFCKAMPFHIVFDREMVVFQAGISMRRVLPSLVVGRTKVSEILEIVRPHVNIDFNSILSRPNSMFLLKTNDGVLDSSSLSTISQDDIERIESPSMRFKGQMLYLEETDNICFLCSPMVLNLDGLNEKGKMHICLCLEMQKCSFNFILLLTPLISSVV